MNILPGEPVPPGFEDELDRVAEIQSVIDMYKGNALVGLEYTVELNDEMRPEPAYFCVLCEKRGDPRTIMQHWTSFNHRLKYLEKHYPTVMRELHPLKYKPNSNQIMVLTVQKLAEAIEDHHGRLTLPVCNADEFQRQKRKVINEIMGKFHFDERSGPNFVNMIDRSLWEAGDKAKGPMKIKAPKRFMNSDGKGSTATRDGFDEISSDSDHDSKKLRKTESRTTREFMGMDSVSPRKSKVLPTPKELGYQSTQIAEEGYKWEKYRCTLEMALKQMTEEQKIYEKNPESHPLYPETWKKYWNRRYKEIQAENKVDPNKYDYKPEWIVFWNQRMSEIFEEDLKRKKLEIKKKVGLAEDAVEKVEQLKEKYKLPTSKKDAPPASKNLSGGLDVIDISDDDSNGPSQRMRRRLSTSLSPSRRSHSPRGRFSGGARNFRVRSRSRSSSREHERYERRHRGAANAAPPPPPPAHGYGSHEHDYYAGHQIPPPGSVYTRLNRNGGHGIPRPMPPSHYRVMDSHKYPKYERSPSPSAASKEDILNASDASSLEQEGPLTVVSVLRLLTALEGNLGSMGPKVVDMLAKALALEKVKANSADDLLLNEDHCVFFETIKEKLKGLLIADMIDDPQKIRTIKKAIQNIANVIHQVTTRAENAAKTVGADAGDAKAKHMFNKPDLKDLPFDRQLVATKLAAALVMQGREDVSTEDMDKLIFFFVLMARMSHTQERVLHMKDVLPELGLAAPEPSLPVAPMAAALAAALPSIVDEFLEKEVSALVQEEISHDQADRTTTDPNGSSSLEALTDSDLQTLLQNFKHLSADEQHHLAAHLRKLQTTDPVRVMRLSKFINSSQQPQEAAPDLSPASSMAGRSKETPQESSVRSDSSLGLRSQDHEPSSSSGTLVNGRRPAAEVTAHTSRFALDDDEDDDYSFDDVFKAASSNVQRFSDNSRESRTSKATATATTPREGDKSKSSPSDALKFNAAGLNVSLSDTQNLIANLMGSLQQSNNNARKNSAAATTSAKSVPAVGSGGGGGSAMGMAGQQQHQQQQTPNVPFYQQQQHHQQQLQQQGGDPYAAGMGGYGQQMTAEAYYNMHGYNQAAGYMGGSAGYAMWGQGMSSVNMNMQQYPAFQQQQQQQQHHSLGYNMYGQQNRN